MLNNILLFASAFIALGGLTCIGFAIFGKARKGEESKEFWSQKIN